MLGHNLFCHPHITVPTVNGFWDKLSPESRESSRQLVSGDKNHLVTKSTVFKIKQRGSNPALLLSSHGIIGESLDSPGCQLQHLGNGNINRTKLPELLRKVTKVNVRNKALRT